MNQAPSIRTGRTPCQKRKDQLKRGSSRGIEAQGNTPYKDGPWCKLSQEERISLTTIGLIGNDVQKSDGTLL